jgi:hypothetical protein
VGQATEPLPVFCGLLQRGAGNGNTLHGNQSPPLG